MENDNEKIEVIHTKIWQEEPSVDNPFVADKCFCSGYDVYGELLNKASWFEYIWLLFKLEKPERWQAELLEKIAIAVANPGIRDHSVRAAMNAGVGGSSSASALMAALAVGAGQLNGAREIFIAMEWWAKCGKDINEWKVQIINPPKLKRASVWDDIEHFPGFDPHSSFCAKPVLQTLEALKSISDDGKLFWLAENRQELEKLTKSPLSMTGVIACAFAELDLTCEQAEMIYLFLKLPGAAAHALEQKKMGWKKYPFFGPALKITNDPG
ncbi:MAG: citryl-CoA lyase [Gammaproteobacteria bacterium]|nr:citryl-CoA lyase [Gammaproteobacteria bacterium]